MAILAGDVILEISIKARASGHQDPWVTGTPVTFAPHCKVVGGQGYRKIGVKTTSEENTDWVHLPFESVGLIVEHKFGIAEYVDHIDVVAGRLKTNVHMWYLVAFRELLWVRYDWLTKWSAQ